MPLSEGATRARQARRLLQRVLEFAPEGATIHPIVRIGRHAAEGIVEAAAEEEADLILFGWGGRSPVARPQPPGARGPPAGGRLQPDHRRGRPRGALRHRRRQAAWRGRIRRILVPVRGGPHAELALPLRRRHRPAARRDVDVLHVVPPGITRPSAPRPSGRCTPSSASTSARPATRCSANRATCAPRSCARPRRPTWSSWAPPPSPAAPPEATCSARCRRRSPSAPARRSSWSRPGRRIGRQTFEQLAEQAETLEAAERAAEEARAVPARVERWFAESNFHHAEFADLRRSSRSRRSRA